MVCEWVASGDLIVLDPALDTTPTMRFVFVTKEVREALYGPWDDLEREVRYNRMRAVVDAFVAGARMAVRYPTVEVGKSTNRAPRSRRRSGLGVSIQRTAPGG